MRILIDGYNLLHASGVFATQSGPDTFQQSRQALLDAIAELLEPRLVAQTCVVFDAAGAPPGLPRRTTHRGISVQYAPQPADADQVIEDLIDAHRAPRELLVVSSDHRVQRSARRRGAEFVDSETWFKEITQQARLRGTGDAQEPTKPSGPPSSAEVRYWLREFGLEGPDLAGLHEPDAPNPIPQSPAQPADFDAEFDIEEFDDPDDPIFPPGYGEDLLEEE